jgi:hypothetical protein
LACVSTFDDEGRLHGVSRRYHPNGEPSLAAPYVAGKLHGKQIATRPSSGDSPEMRELAELDGVFRAELLYLDGVSQHGMTTLYGVEGLFAPVAYDREGRSIALGSQLEKLRPGTALELVGGFLRSMGGKIPRSMVRTLHYAGPALVGGSLQRVQVGGRRGERSIAIVPREAFGELTLAVDRRVVALGSGADPLEADPSARPG